MNLTYNGFRTIPRIPPSPYYESAVCPIRQIARTGSTDTNLANNGHGQRVTAYTVERNRSSVHHDPIRNLCSSWTIKIAPEGIVANALSRDMPTYFTARNERVKNIVFSNKTKPVRSYTTPAERRRKKHIAERHGRGSGEGSNSPNPDTVVL